MELNKFIQETLGSIIEGLEATKEKYANTQTGVVVNPRMPDMFYADPTIIKFDIAVTVEESTKAEGEAKINVLGVKMGGGGDVGSKSSSATRISFDIPIALPSVSIHLFK